MQGVFFRAFTRNVAAKLGLCGWVKNLYDGRVEAVVEGDRTIIEEAIRRYRVGPPGAHVGDVEVKWEEFSGKEKGFEIRY